MKGTISHRPIPSIGRLTKTLAHYNIGRIISIKRAGGTANANFIVKAEEGIFFLRLRNPKYSNVHQVIDDHNLIHFLLKRGMPVPRIVPTETGETFIKSDIGAYELSEYVEGEEFSGKASQIAEAARWLAKFHKNARDWEPLQVKETIPKRYDEPEDFLPRWEELLRAAGRCDELDYIYHQAELANEKVNDEIYDELSDWTIHGDYTAGNILFKDKKLVGIFDFDWAGRHPRLRDIADLLMHFCTRRDAPIRSEDIASLTRAFSFDSEKISIALNCYKEILPLSKQDIELLPAFVRRRWIYSRAAATFKVSPEKQLDVLTVNFKGPLLWLDENEETIFGGDK